MPARERNIIFPAWSEDLPDTCLRKVVRQAVIARSDAVDNGALKHKSCRAVFESADKTLDQIEFHRITGDIACTKAATALRKFNTAAECGHPTGSTLRRASR